MLTDKYGVERSTFNGAVRCYMPSFSREDDPYKHKLWLRENIRRIDAMHPNGFLNACLRHCFAAATAQFEPYPLLTPAALKRKLRGSVSAADVAVASTPTQHKDSVERSSTLDVASTPDVVDLPAPAEAPQFSDENVAQAIKDSYERRLSEMQLDIHRLEGVVQEARDETAQKNRQVTELQSELQELEDVREDLNRLKGEYEVKETPVLRDFWDGFNLFFGSAKNLVSSFESLQRDSQEYQRIIGDQDKDRDEIVQLKAKLYHSERKAETVSLDERLDKRPLYPSSWDELIKIEGERMKWLIFLRHLPGSLLRCPFDHSLAKEIDGLLAVLNSLAFETRLDGSLSTEGLALQQEHFSKQNAWFSDESETNKRIFKAKLTFDDPEDPSRTLWCPWHGKVNKQQFRIHFEWPRPPGQRHVKVTYIGPKITKQ